MREDIMTTYKELLAIRNGNWPSNEPSKKVYYVGTDPVTGIMVVSCDFHILGHGLDNVETVLAHNSEAARIEYNALR